MKQFLGRGAQDPILHLVLAVGGEDGGRGLLRQPDVRSAPPQRMLFRLFSLRGALQGSVVHLERPPVVVRFRIRLVQFRIRRPFLDT